MKVPHWVRGAESARMLAPLDKPLHMLGLGMSVGTPSGGITAGVVAVSDFDELAKLGREKIQGKIVALQRRVTTATGLRRVYRRQGARARRRYGAVAALVRSATPLAMQIPHTGEMSYDESQPKIPAAAISPEDAMMLARSGGWRRPGDGAPGDDRPHGAGRGFGRCDRRNSRQASTPRRSW